MKKMQKGLSHHILLANLQNFKFLDLWNKEASLTEGTGDTARIHESGTSQQGRPREEENGINRMAKVTKGLRAQKYVR